MGEKNRGRDGGEGHKAATAFPVSNAGARQAERGVPSALGANACAEATDADGTADTALAEVEPEGAEVDGFSIIKAHGEKFSCG